MKSDGAAMFPAAPFFCLATRGHEPINLPTKDLSDWPCSDSGPNSVYERNDAIGQLVFRDVYRKAMIGARGRTTWRTLKLLSKAVLT